jgi:hypothetical protein
MTIPEVEEIIERAVSGAPVPQGESGRRDPGDAGGSRPRAAS